MHAFYQALTHWLAKLSFGGGTRVEFYQSIALLLRNQVLLNKALQELYVVYSANHKRPDEPLAIIIRDCLNKMDEGSPFGESLRVWLPVQEATLLVAGEESGKLEVALQSAERLIKAKGRIVGSILGACAYPCVLFGLTGFLLRMVSTKLVPALSQVVPPSQWKGSALMLYKLSEFVTHYGLYTVIGVVGGLTLSIISLPWFCGPLRIFLDKLPPWSLYRMTEGASFLLNTSALIGSGLQLNVALEILGQQGSPWLRERVNAARAQLAEGKNFGEALTDTGYGFPDTRANRFISVIASYRGLGPAMEDFAKAWLETTVKRVEQLSGILLMLGIGCVGVVMLLVVSGAGGLQDAAQHAASSQL